MDTQTTKIRITRLATLGISLVLKELKGPGMSAKEFAGV